MSFPSQVAIASSNRGKIREIASICRDWPVEWLTAEGRGGWPSVEETGGSYLANARLKATAVARALGVPAVADDSGIEVDALSGAPGMRSARFGGPEASDEENLAKLLRELKGVASDRRTARYRCVALIAWPDRREVHAEAICQGTLIHEPRGTGGFGYDPIFVPDGETRTMAELPPDEKDRISHRGKAFRALAALLEET